MQTNTNFWHQLDHLLATSKLVIDRPQGSTHPRYPTITYPYDYGYLEDTQSMDGDGIDVWVGSLAEKTVTGIVCTLDMNKRDSEIKILLGCSVDEAAVILAVHNKGDQSAILVTRNTNG